MTASRAPPAFLAFSGLRLRLWPLILAALIMQLCLVPARELVRWLFLEVGPGGWADDAGMLLFTAIMLQGLCGLLNIAVMGRLLPRADLHWPPGLSMVGLAAAIGVVMGLELLFERPLWHGFRASPHHRRTSAGRGNHKSATAVL
ncbi:hypothetical protein [Nannocystis bainbridge]|uniref:Uncharacterized protein n=1 Tax=Nannocystis bainbridge TaxID=2995303 RepID=A0ABT5DRA5_9BACT|nr:hypothetical protein [Nannocystis bainbridge]MDC0716160.1 hypothetical protein [Nannocystis bainbridge]